VVLVGEQRHPAVGEVVALERGTGDPRAVRSDLLAAVERRERAAVVPARAAGLHG
jgi:hypothetical protein